MFAKQIIALAALCLAGCGASDADLAARATEAVVANGGRIISLKADASRFLACGWADLGAPDGPTPVMVYADPMDPLTRPLVRVVTPRLHEGDLAARVDAAYERQLVLVSCDHGLMPQTPAGAKGDDETLATLWTTSRPAVIASPLGHGFIAVTRRPGGGAAASPVFATRETASNWAE